MNYLEKIPDEAILKFHVNYGDDRWFETFEWTYFHKTYNAGYVAVTVEDAVASDILVTIEVDGIHYLPINRHSNSNNSKVQGFKLNSRSMSPDIIVNLDEIQTIKIAYGWWRVKVFVEYDKIMSNPTIMVPRFLTRIEVLE